MGISVALVRKLGHLREHAVGAVPTGEDLFGQDFLALTDGHQQRAIARFLGVVGDVRLGVVENVFVGRQALHHHAGFRQGRGVDLRLGADQLLDLTAYQVLLVWPELHLPRPVAFGQRADQQRLQLGPGFLCVQEVGAGGVQAFLALAVGQGADGQLTVGLNPAAIGWQDHLFGDGCRGHCLRVLGRASAQGQGGEAGEQQLGTKHVELPSVSGAKLIKNSGTPATRHAARH